MKTLSAGAAYAVHFPATANYREHWRIVARLGFPQAEVATEADARAWLQLLTGDPPLEARDICA